MRIAAVEHALPSHLVTNEAIIRRVREQNRDGLAASELIRIEDTIDGYLTAAGTETRYQFGDDERAIDLVVDASRRALAAADVSPDTVDFVIYTGVGRGWIEPAMACAVQAELGLRNATCFDILDACASWLRALHVAHGHIRSGTYRHGLIVNCECGLYRHHAAWRFRSHDDLAHRLAMFTIGEAATATLVTANGHERDYYFTFRSFAEHHRLCMVPLPGAEAFWSGPPEDRLAPGVFFSLSRELLSAGARLVVETYESDPRLRGQRHDIVFAHSPSVRVCDVIARRLGVEHILFPTHRDYGNTVSACVPLAMSLALKANRLARGHRVLIAVGSAGITVGFCSFTF